MFYRGFTILKSGPEESYEIFHPKEGVLQKCGVSPSIEEAEEVIDVRLQSRDFVIDLKAQGPSH
ncbi:hypothetical protein LCGC14_1747220 [marine sediment metagenome]|uniref:Uncharacterized protein n=1 Tax=marine sediment metagenome TaxID=412755 RepID=A0A0F9JK51_9ZZZZ